MELLQLVETPHCALAELLLTADDEEVSVRARVERHRQAPVALAADVPVAHVVEPVLHPIACVRRGPAHLLPGPLHLPPPLVHRDETLLPAAEDDLLPAAPADRIA